MKKIWLILLHSLLLATVGAQAQTYTNSDGLVYLITNGAIDVTGYAGIGGAVAVPNTISNFPVTSLGENAFAYISGPTSIAISGNVTNIALGAFGGCWTLTAITVDATNPAYSSVGGVLFDENQSTLIAFPSGLMGSYGIPGGVTSIAYAAFFGSALTTVTIPNSVTNIGGWAFSGSSLASVTIPNSVTSIGEAAFQQCDLSSISIPSSVTSIAFAECDDCVSLTNVTFPNSITNIGGFAFCDCPLGSVTIPASVTSIEDDAFSYCSDLTAAYFQGNAPSGDSTVFTNDVALTAVYYLAGATGWGPTYYGIPAVELNAPVPVQLTYSVSNGTAIVTGYTGTGNSVNIPNTINGLPVTSVAENAFLFAYAITNLTIGTNVTSIGEAAFSVSGLTSVFIPANVTNIGVEAFDYCLNLTAISVTPQNPVYSSLNGVLFDKNQATLLEYPGGVAGNYTIPGSVGTIGTCAFQFCYYLTGVTIPSGVTNIQDDAFEFSAPT